jgi:hypothetical protein
MKIELIAIDIKFTEHSIVYIVKQKGEINHSGVVFCSNDIKHKDLVLNPTMIDENNLEVIFTPTKVISHFYQSILDGSIRNVEEYVVEKNNIYITGDVVGYISI